MQPINILKIKKIELKKEKKRKIPFSLFLFLVDKLIVLDVHYDSLSTFVIIMF